MSAATTREPKEKGDMRVKSPLGMGSNPTTCINNDL